MARFSDYKPFPLYDVNYHSEILDFLLRQKLYSMKTVDNYSAALMDCLNALHLSRRYGDMHDMRACISRVFSNWRHLDGLSPSSLKVRARLFSVIEAYARAEGGYTGPALPLPRIIQGPQPARSNIDAKQVFDFYAYKTQSWAEQCGQTAAMLAAFCGLRASEIAGIMHGDFDFTDNSIYIYGKGDIPRRVLMPSVVIPVIDFHFWWFQKEFSRGCEANEYIFSRLPGLVPDKKTVLKCARIAFSAAGLGTLEGLHIFRRFAAQFLFSSGADLATVQLHLGHSRPATTLHYLRPTSGDLRAALERAFPPDLAKLV